MERISRQLCEDVRLPFEFVELLMNPVVRLSDVRFSYGSRSVLRGVAFEIGRGESVLLLGANGAGKTTLLSCLIGLLRPSGGDIVMNGKARRPGDPAWAGLPAGIAGWVEEPAFFLERSGRFQLEADAWMVGQRLAKRDVADACQEIGFDPSDLERAVHGYSAGMRKKLGIIRALLRHPDLLIVDEPMNGLDPNGVRDLRDALRKVRIGRGATLLVSSHVIAEAQRWATRAIILHEGVISDDVSMSPECDPSDEWRMRLEDPIASEDREWLARQTRVLRTDDDRTLRLRLDGAHAARRLLAEAVARGFPVVEFVREPRDVEALFFARSSEENRVAN